ncbi:1861_t:CDS:2 [Racocetra persica]|uniref:1861_t:CDS:1 n=1 Tax=Racocetra persica TaxID=160502 RepID=A0ACA9KNZ0_9GLOM|nr:1861_t:CDS:2 [Racocetra persica]
MRKSSLQSEISFDSREEITVLRPGDLPLDSTSDKVEKHEINESECLSIENASEVQANNATLINDEIIWLDTKFSTNTKAILSTNDTQVSISNDNLDKPIKIENSQINNHESGGTENLLKRRPGAPANLNLVFKPKNSDNDQSSTILSSRSDNSGLATATRENIELLNSDFSQVKSDSLGNDLNPEDSKKQAHSSFTSITPKQNHWKDVKKYIGKTSAVLGALPKGELDRDLLAKLEEQNSLLPKQNSVEFILARIERQNQLLDNDPKSVCIQSNGLKANLETIQSLIDDSTNPAIEGDELLPNEKITDWDFWSALIQDYTSVATKLPELLTAKLQSGVPPKLRGLVWQSMCQASSTYLETMYSQLLSESSPYDKIIERDLARTFPHIDMFKEENGKGQTGLWNILKAYSLYDPLVGYCQGLGFLVGPMLMNMTEAQAFCVFVRLMETYDMRTMFTLNMEGLQLRLYQFSALLAQILPKLHEHFQHHAIHPAMFASQWFLSLFAYTYPLPLVLRIYDIVFAEGAPETIMRVAIALLKKNESNLLSYEEFEDLLDFLTSRLYEAYDNKPTGLIKDAMALSSVITKAKLDQLSKSYVKELEDQKKRSEKLVAQSVASLQSVTNISNDVPATSVSNDVSLSSDNDSIVSSTPTTASFDSNNTGLLHTQIEDLVTALSQLQKEHADVLEQLVCIKMEKMDLVTEVEGLKSRLRGVEKENKRLSANSVVFSIDSTTISLSDISRLEDSELTPRPSTDTMSHKMTVSDSDTDMLTRAQQLVSTFIPKSHEREEQSPNISALTEELIKVKMQKFDLVQENEELLKRNEDLESALQLSKQEHILLQEKNISLLVEIERLDEEAAQAVYEKNSMEFEIKEARDIKVQNGKLIKEVEKLKKEVEQLKQKGSNKNTLQDAPTIKHSTLFEFIVENVDDASISSRRRDSESQSISSIYSLPQNQAMENEEFQIVTTCNGECDTAKRIDELEKMLINVKMKLAQSEEVRESLGNQLDGLRHLVNGYNDDLSPTSPTLRPRSPRSEKRASTLSLASFFGVLSYSMVQWFQLDIGRTKSNVFGWTLGVQDLIANIANVKNHGWTLNWMSNVKVSKYPILSNEMTIRGHEDLIILEFNGLHGRFPGKEMNNFMLVLQYATDGNLREYLRSKIQDGIYKILWADLIRLTKEITLGLNYLHNKK